MEAAAAATLWPPPGKDLPCAKIGGKSVRIGQQGKTRIALRFVQLLQQLSEQGFKPGKGKTMTNEAWLRGTAAGVGLRRSAEDGSMSLWFERFRRTALKRGGPLERYACYARCLV